MQAVCHLKEACGRSFRSPRKEARILTLVADHPQFMHGFSMTDSRGNIVRVIDHGLSRQEQFLFGSVSNALVNHARHCTVWVVE